jgi:hypothetical protein
MSAGAAGMTEFEATDAVEVPEVNVAVEVKV